MKICPAYALAHVAPNFLAELSPAERFVLPHVARIWRRPEQIFPEYHWRSLGLICGRGFGKTDAIVRHMNAGVEDGSIRAPALMGPKEDRVDEVQCAALIALAPPWFKPFRARGGLEWPNGVRAEIHSAEAPNSSRSSNLDFTWLCEIVAWDPIKRGDAFANITTATRVGRAQFVWDTTSKGKNELILALEAAHAEDPTTNVIVRGTTFDNPMLTRQYLREECRKYRGRRYAEELEGKVFAESAGALWKQDTIDANRRAAPPTDPALVLVAVDPALSAASTSDETGIVKGMRGRDGHSYVTQDDSGHHTPAEWARIVVDHCARDTAGVVIERNHLGDNATHAIMSEARTRGLVVEVLPRTTKEFPARRPGVIFVREVVAASSKSTRAAGPAAESDAGRVHVCGDDMAELELELTTYEPGTRKSPNRYDAHAYLVTELAGLEHDQPGARAAADTRAAADVGAELRARLAQGIRGGRRVGL